MRIALIAHDDEKPSMVEWASEHESILAANDLIGTGTTGGRLNDETGLSVTRLESGPLGGDLMIGAEIVTGDCDAVIFFRDPMTAQPHEPDISAGPARRRCSRGSWTREARIRDPRQRSSTAAS